MTLEMVLEGIGKELEAGAELVAENGQSEKILEFRTAAEQIRRELQSVEETGRLMRLGIVGEVKAGKTSFLNALLFEGKNVLPKAATPMTAALTRIRYSEHPCAKVVFYDETDWDGFVTRYADSYEQTLERKYEEYKARFEADQKRRKQQDKIRPLTRNSPEGNPKPKMMTRAEFEAASRSQMSVEERSCKEIYDMARERMGDAELHSLLGTTQTLEASDEHALMEQLGEYVGAKGRYTPIVKYTTLDLNLPELQGVEIIDTPGMNDPIISRGRTTKNFLKECDALFILSYCGQFLGAEDMALITRTVPEEGVARCVLIGTKMDSAVRQYPRRDAMFEDAYKGTMASCLDQARENLARYATTQLTERLGEFKQPYLTSAMAYSAAVKLERGEPLDAEEDELIAGLRSRFPNFEPGAQDLRAFSRIASIREKVYPAIRADKDRIIEESMRQTREGQRGKFLRLLEEIGNETRQLERDLRGGDVEQLREKLQSARDALDSARTAVTGIFDTASVRVAKNIIPALQIDVRAEVNNHLHIDVNSTTTTEHHRSTSGFWIWKKTESWDEHITTHTANVADVEGNLRSFYTEILRLVNDAMREAVQLDRVKEQVINAIIGAFDTGDRNFDENAILIPINNALERITIAHVEVDLERYMKQLDRELAGIGKKDNAGKRYMKQLDRELAGIGKKDNAGKWFEPTLYENGAVKNEGIPLLRQAQGHVLAAITEDVCRAIGQEGDRIARELEERAGIFIDQITQKLESNHRKVESMIADKENNLTRLNAFIQTLSAAKQKIMEADR